MTTSYLFVRQLRWCPATVASRFGGLIVATRYNRRAINRDAIWARERGDLGREIVGMDWLPLPGEWRPGLRAQVEYLHNVNARALCLNVEPLPPRHTNRWEGKRDEAHTFASEARDLCDRHGLELWFSSWARPSARRSFPWLEFVRPAHVCVPQPYEVHGRSGDAYVSEVLEEWRDHGAKRFVVGRGAHELDKSDADAWRTGAEIEAHRESTPAGMSEAWWTPAGTPPLPLVEAMTRPLRPTSPPPAPDWRADLVLQLEALAASHKDVAGPLLRAAEEIGRK